MSLKKIQVGQVWRKVGSEETFLVTRLYTEVLATIAILRPTGSENAAMLRIKVERNPEGQTIPGFSMARILTLPSSRACPAALHAISQIERTGIATMSSTCSTSLARNGSAYSTPAISP